jgi:hypothetical protein
MMAETPPPKRYPKECLGNRSPFGSAPAGVTSEEPRESPGGLTSGEDRFERLDNILAERLERSPVDGAKPFLCRPER